MTYEVKFTNEAQTDLRSIFEYIAFQLQEPENAKRQFLRIEEMILSLDNMPERNRLYEREPLKSRGLRVLPIDNYVIFYIPDAVTMIVTIIRIMYAGRDIENQLRLAKFDT